MKKSSFSVSSGTERSTDTGWSARVFAPARLGGGHGAAPRANSRSAGPAATLRKSRPEVTLRSPWRLSLAFKILHGIEGGFRGADKTFGQSNQVVSIVIAAGAPIISLFILFSRATTPPGAQPVHNVAPVPGGPK